MPVILHLGAFSHGEAKARENAHDLIAHEHQRMPCAKSHRRCRTAQVEAFVEHIGALGGSLEGIDFLGGKIFQRVDFHTHRLFLIGGDIAEIGHQSAHGSFFREVFDAKRFYLLRSFCLKRSDFGLKLLYLL